MIIEPPKTLAEFKSIEKTILEMMKNPYCDSRMLESLTKKLEDCRDRIRLLESTES